MPEPVPPDLRDDRSKAFKTIKTRIMRQVPTLFDTDESPGTFGRTLAWHWGYWGRVMSVLYSVSQDADLLDMFEQTHDRFLAMRDDALGLHDDVRGGVHRTWGTRLGGSKDKGLRACELESTGLILLPFTDMLLRNKAHLPEALGEKLCQTICEGLDAHLPDKKPHEASGGAYFISPWTDQIEPLNHTHLFAASAAEAFAITGQQAYGDLAQQCYAFFKHNWYKERNGTISWAYAPTPGSSEMRHFPMRYGLTRFRNAVGAELFYKAGVSIELPLAMARAGLLPEGDLALIAQSLNRNLFSHKGDINIFIGPRKRITSRQAMKANYIIRPAYICNFYRLADQCPELQDNLDRFIESRPDWFPKGLLIGRSEVFALTHRLFDAGGTAR